MRYHLTNMDHTESEKYDVGNMAGCKKCKCKDKDGSATTPSHYQHAIQPIDYIMANKLGFAEGNVVKYVTRWREKGGIEDLEKAKVYIDFLINQETKGAPR